MTSHIATQSGAALPVRAPRKSPAPTPVPPAYLRNLGALIDAEAARIRRVEAPAEDRP